MLKQRRTGYLLASAAALWASSAMAQTIPFTITSATVTPRTTTPPSYNSTPVTIPVEDNYLPNVVWRENGAASYQALKVQAVAARGYLYYKLSQTPNGGKATSIQDGTADQVYSISPTAPFTRSTATGSQLNHLRSVDETEREIMLTAAGEPVATFYVAAGRPDTGPAGTIWPAGAPLGQWETGDQDPTTTEHWVTYNRGLTGASVQPTPLGSLSNPVNRGAMSQNGSSFLGAGRSGRANPAENFAAWDYVDILKYYYGQDTQMALARVPTTGQMPAFVKQIASFDYSEGYLRNRMDFSTTNSTNINYPGSSHVRDTSTAQSGAASQRIVVDINEIAPTGNFTYRHMSGMVMGTEANPTLNDANIGTKTANLLIENRGSIGFWIKTTKAGLSARPLLDDGATSTEQGLLRNIIPDGQWHKYEWYLTDAPEWTSFSGGNNAISGNWTLDSILFSGSGDTTLNLDNVFYNASTTPPANQWVHEADGSWNFAGNWVSSSPNAVGATANLLAATPTRRVVTITAPVTVGTLNLNNPQGYEIFNNSATFVGLTLDVATGPAAINVISPGTQIINSGLSVRDNANITVAAGGTLEINGSLSVGASGVGKTITKLGAGTLTINAPQTHQPGTVLAVSEGAANLNRNGGTNLSLNISGSGRVKLGADQDLRAVNIAFGEGGLQQLNLASGTGAGDFHQLRVFATDLAAAKSSLYGTLMHAAANPGDGIIDSGLASHPNSAIGIARMTDHILIRPTRIGDVNLDGTVTIADFLSLAGNFNAVGATWQEGDMNYDMAVTIADFLALAANFNSSYSGQSWEISPEDQLSLATFAESIGAPAAVPEPALLGLLPTALLLSRRTRRREQLTQTNP
jgi:hypothetical protein